MRGGSQGSPRLAAVEIQRKSLTLTFVVNLKLLGKVKGFFVLMYIEILNLCSGIFAFYLFFFPVEFLYTLSSPHQKGKCMDPGHSPQSLLPGGKGSHRRTDILHIPLECQNPSQSLELGC